MREIWLLGQRFMVVRQMDGTPLVVRKRAGANDGWHVASPRQQILVLAGLERSVLL